MFAPPPNVTDYTTFLYEVVGIPAVNLPSTAPIIAMSLQIATDIVSKAILFASADMYVLAVYNLAADRLFNFASDVEGQTYFDDYRKKWKILSLSVGVPAAASDQGTSVGLLNPESLKGLTLANLQNLKTPMGRDYLQIAQSLGAIWGVS
jgi:hypothetical protein